MHKHHIFQEKSSFRAARLAGRVQGDFRQGAAGQLAPSSPRRPHQGLACSAHALPSPGHAKAGSIRATRPQLATATSPELVHGFGPISCENHHPRHINT
ncbi:hypothetical protein QL285_058121 [Trifolium repens]|nr:hypothetical protein QL285_058121 [Trifolium repens]